MRDENRVIKGLWVGPELSAMEQLSISSYIAHGHDFHLFVYEPVRNVPPGTTVRDGNEILPASRIFQYRDHASYAGFANFFRYKLLLEKGGWWSDTDSVCLKPFDFAEEYVFSSEFSLGAQMPNNGVMKAPAGGEALRWAWESCNVMDPATLVWGESGPALMRQAIGRFSLERFVKPWETFCPVGFREWRKIIDPAADFEPRENSFAVHLWHEQWRAAGEDKNVHRHPGCLYERFRRQYLAGQDRISLDRIEAVLRSMTS